jgi:hypothetical protein
MRGPHGDSTRGGCGAFADVVSMLCETLLQTADYDLLRLDEVGVHMMELERCITTCSLTTMS